MGSPILGHYIEVDRQVREYLQVKNLLLVSSGTLALRCLPNSALRELFVLHLASLLQLVPWHGMRLTSLQIGPISLNLSAPLVEKKLEGSSDFDSISNTFMAMLAL